MRQHQQQAAACAAVAASMAPIMRFQTPVNAQMAAGNHAALMAPGQNHMSPAMANGLAAINLQQQAAAQVLAQQGAMNQHTQVALLPTKNRRSFLKIIKFWKLFICCLFFAFL